MPIPSISSNGTPLYRSHDSPHSSRSSRSSSSPLRCINESPKLRNPLIVKQKEEPESGRSCLAQGLASHSPIARRLLEATADRSGNGNHLDDMELSFSSTPRGGNSTPLRNTSGSPSNVFPWTHRHSPKGSEHERRRKEDEDSVALARMLMAQEAMESYALSADYLRYNASQYSQEDMQALQAMLAEEEEEASDDSPDTNNYEMMLRLGETIGDVKKDRWKMVADKHISDLPTYCFQTSMADGLGENDTRRKCQVCQCDYEEKETIKMLPCRHCFHADCVDQWLKSNDSCAYCRKTIVADR